MAEGGALTFSDPDGYASAFGDAGIKLTITGAGDFKARLIWLKLKGLEVYCCSENLPRIAYISLPPERLFLSLPIGLAPPMLGGLTLRNGYIVFHSCGERVHQRSSGECQWGLISLSADRLETCTKALTGRSIISPAASMILRPSRAESSRLQGLLKQASHLAETKRKLIERAEVARSLEQEMLHAITHCLSTHAEDDTRRTRHHHAAMMVRFEEEISKCIDRKINIPMLCAEIGVAERTLRLCCTEFLGVSPMRYLLLQRLNKARLALQRADPSIASVAEVARNHQFLELGRFAVTYRATFGESPSATLARDRRTYSAEIA